MIKLHASQFANSQFPLPSHPKTRGQIAETLFIVAALLRGFIVAKVEGDNAPFDVFLAAGRANYRIQIKSAWKSTNGGYQFVSARSRSVSSVPSVSSVARPFRKQPKISPYLPGEADFIAAYLAPDAATFNSSHLGDWSIPQFRTFAIPQLGDWFIIPAAELAHIKSLHLRSSAKARSKYARFRNAWHLLQSN
jgi:hypothetical protein